jgi:hypothetical protein
METDFLCVDISSTGVSASDLKSALSHDEQGALDRAEFRIPKPTPGGLGMLDPGTIQVLLTLGTGTGAIALALKGLFKVLD